MDRLLREELLEQLAPAAEPLGAELLRRPHGRGRVLRIDDEKRSVLGAEEAGGVKCLERGDFTSALDGLTDGDEGRHIRVLRAERSRDDRAEVRHRHRLRRDVAGVPVILMPRVQDEAEVGGVERADDGPAVDDARDLLEPGGELDVVDRRVDRRERAEDVLDVDAGLERRVPLRVEGFGLGHAAGHPEHDHGVGLAACRAEALAQACCAEALAKSGSRPARAASVAPAVAPMNPRRLTRA